MVARCVLMDQYVSLSLVILWWFASADKHVCLADLELFKICFLFPNSVFYV